MCQSSITHRTVCLTHTLDRNHCISIVHARMPSPEGVSSLYIVARSSTGHHSDGDAHEVDVDPIVREQIFAEVALPHADCAAALHTCDLSGQGLQRRQKTADDWRQLSAC